MVARPGTYQASNNSGELKPELHGRTDLKQFYGGLAYARNIEPVPQGGSRLSPRTRHMGRARRVMEEIPATAVIPGGAVTGAATLAQLNFSSPQQVSVVVIAALSANIPVPALLQFQYFNGAWIGLSTLFGAGPDPKCRSVACAPGAPVTATAVRLQLIGPIASTAFSVNVMFARRETAAMLPGRLVPFTFSIDQTYQAILLGDHVDFYRDGVFAGGAFTFLNTGIVPTASIQQRFDTMLVFHESAEPRRIVRDGADDRWVTDVPPFTNTPRVDLGGTYTNQVADDWFLYLRFPTTGAYANGVGLSVVFTVNGEQTTAVPCTGDWNVFAAAAKAAIEALPSIGPGIDVHNFGVQPDASFTDIIFFGADNLGSNNVVAAQVINTTAGAATTSHQQFGKPGGEDLFSPSAGYPACGQFYQDRLVLAGFKSKRSALLASVTGDYFNNNIELVAASGAILNNLDTDGAERIVAMARSRHLVIFTTDAEYFISDRVLSKTATPTIVNSSRNGSSPGLGVVENEGSLIYVSRNNALIYAATYDDVSTSYVSAPISLLASHIASDVTGISMQKPSNATDAGRLWLPRADGTATLGTMLRGESVTAFTRWETAGSVRSMSVDGKNVAYALVERTVAGVQELHFERLEPGLIFDGTIEQNFTPPRTHITGLAAHEGAEVWALADGYISGPFTVTAGAIDLADASSHVLVGRWTPFIADTLPLPSEVAERVVLRRPKRVHTVKLDLVDTTSVAVGANGLPPREVTLSRAGDPLDAPQAPVNRTVNVTGLRGFSAEGKVRITQTKPGLCAWRGITIEART